MTKEELIKKGIDKEWICETTIGLDELVQSKYDRLQDFWFHYCFSKIHGPFRPPYEHYTFEFKMLEIKGDGLKIIVWAEEWL